MTTAGLLYVPITGPCINNSFQPVSGATLTINITGAGLATIYADAALTTPVTNPQTSNSSGRFFAQSNTIFADASVDYDAILTFPDGESFTFTSIPLIPLGVANITGFAPLNSPNFTGVPTAPTPALNDNSGKIATTAFVKGQNYAALNSPAFTGVPTAPTAASGTSTTQLATTAFVNPGSSQAANGYRKFSDGLIMQWGTTTVNAPGSGVQTFNIVLPLTYPTAHLFAVGAPANSGSFSGVAPAVGVGPGDTSHVQITWHAAGAGALGMQFFSIGN